MKHFEILRKIEDVYEYVDGLKSLKDKESFALICFTNGTIEIINMPIKQYNEIVNRTVLDVIGMAENLSEEKKSDEFVQGYTVKTEFEEAEIEIYISIEDYQVKEVRFDFLGYSLNADDYFMSLCETALYDQISREDYYPY